MQHVRGPGEGLRIHADDRQHGSIHTDGLPDHIRRAAESTLPQAFADDGDGAGIERTVVAGQQGMSQLRTHAQHGVVIA